MRQLRWEEDGRLSSEQCDCNLGSSSKKVRLLAYDLFHAARHLLPRLTVCSTTHQGKCKQDHLTSKRRSRLASRNVFVTIGGRCLSYNGSVSGNSGASEAAVLRTRDASRLLVSEERQENHPRHDQDRKQGAHG